MSATLFPASLVQPPVGDGSFPAGTPIAVPSADGAPTERAVETLARGDMVLTLSGPVAVRVAAGAFGEDQPVAELLLPPEQMVHVLDDSMPGGGLVPLGALVNGGTIRREPQEAVPQWLRLELERPGVVIAAGLLVAARLDPAAAPPVAAVPEAKAQEATAEAPAPEAASAGPAAASPAADQGPQLRIVVKGETLAPLIGGTELELDVMLPPGTTIVRLVSPRGLSPGASGAERAGERRFGVAVRAILLDDAPVPLDGPAIGDGFHNMEATGGDSWRWTNGEGVVHLPPSQAQRRLTVTVSNWHQLLQPE